MHSDANGVVILLSDTVTSTLPVVTIGGIVNASNDSNRWPWSIAAVLSNNLGASLSVATIHPLPITLGGGGIQVGTHNLQQTLNDMELSLDVASAMCPHW